MLARRLLLLVFPFVLACSSSGPDGAAPGSGAQPVPGTPSASGTEARAAALCGAGTRPTVDGACAGVGPTRVPAGFAAAADGWGFTAVRPAAPCGGGTLAELGMAACAPIDDCDAAFPPPGADVVVRPGAPAAGNVVGTLAAAIEKVPAGGTIALDAGAYETFDLGKPATVVGRCAARVVFTASPARAKGIRLFARGTSAIEHVTIRGDGGLIGVRVGLEGTRARVRGVRFEGTGFAVSVEEQGEVTVERSVVRGEEKGRDGDPTAAFMATRAGVLNLEGVDVAGVAAAVVAYDPGTRVRAHRSVLVAGAPAGSPASGTTEAVAAHSGSSVEIEECFVGGRRALASALRGASSDRLASAPPGRVAVVASELAQTGPATGALVANEGAQIALDGVTVRYDADLGATAVDGTLRARGTVFAGSGLERPHRQAIVALRGSRVVLEDSAVVGADQIGVSAAGEGTSLAIARSLIRGTRYRVAPPLADEGDGGRALDLGDGAAAVIEASAFVQNEGTALYVGEGARATLDAALFDETFEGEPGGGSAIVVRDGALAARGSVVRRSARAGLELQAGGALLVDGRLDDGAVGAIVAAGARIEETQEERADVVDGALVLVRTSLAGNRERVRVGP